MSNKKGEVNILLNGFKGLSSPQNATSFFKILNEASSEIMPHYLGLFEPINKEYSIETAIELWQEEANNPNGNGGILFKGKTIRELYGNIRWYKDGSNLFSLSLPIKSVSSKNEVECLIKLVKQLFLWINGVYGFGTHSSQRNEQYTPGHSYQECLGSITWMALFGLPYVSMFGKEVLQTAPCKVEEFIENCFMLLTSEEPCEPTEELVTRQQNVKKHLGEDAFFRRQPKRIFTLDDIKAGRNKTEEFNYRKPNLSAYMKK